MVTSLDPSSGVGISVGASELEDNAVTDAKIAPQVSTKITGLPIQTTDIDRGGTDIKDLSNIEFRETTGAPSGATPYIFFEAAGMRLNALTGDDIRFRFNGDSNYVFDTTQADFKGNNIINVGTIEGNTVPTGTSTFALLDVAQTWSALQTHTANVNMNGNILDNTSALISNATNPADAGAVRMGNGENIEWRNAANNNNVRIGVNSLDTMVFAVNGVAAFSTSATLFKIETGQFIRAGTVGITASTTQTQGQQPLTTDINEVSVVANTNDTVTLPTAIQFAQVLIINRGVNSLQIFPASGDDLGDGVNVATSLSSGSTIRFLAIDTTNWVLVG